MKAPFELPLAVSGSETTTAIWIKDSSGKRVVTVINCENDADRAEFIKRACNEYEATKMAMHHFSDKADRLQAALQLISSPLEGTVVGDPWGFYRDLQAIAAGALSGLPLPEPTKPGEA